MALSDDKIVPAASDPSSATSQHLAYDIDDAAGIVTVVYIGALTDDEVLTFYARLVARHARAPAYDYLLDMRYTDWAASPALVTQIDAIFDSADLYDHCRRIAIVRKVTNIVRPHHESTLRRGMNDRIFAYFTDMELARSWLRERS